jgi:SAM-dependent methyltransferase
VTNEAPTRLLAEPAIATTLLEKVDRTVDPRCEMYSYARTRLEEEPARAYYLDAAHELVERLQAFLEEQGIVLETTSLLDFASGYGRFTRFFVHLFQEVQVSDLEPGMLSFASEHYGVDGFLSSPDPAALPTGRRFDVVFCFSLFTHLPASVWSDWLRALAGLVNRGGLFIFSTRSPALATSLASAGEADEQTPFASVEGMPHAVISRPFQPEERKAVSLYGIRVTAGPGTEGVVEARVPVCTDARWWVEQAFLEPATVPGLSLGPVSAEPAGTYGAWDVVRFRIPFSAQTLLEDVALGGVTAILRLRQPSTVQVEDPDPEIFVAGQPDFQFVPTNETSGRLEPAGYGSTTVTDGFVRRAALQIGGLELVRRFRGGELDRYQDIYAFRRC